MTGESVEVQDCLSPHCHARPDQTRPRDNLTYPSSVERASNAMPCHAIQSELYCIPLPGGGEGEKKGTKAYRTA
jgi:hypothetical protein